MSMSRRARRLCGALSLVAMTLSLAEAGAASTCAPMDGMGETDDGAASMGMEASAAASMPSLLAEALEGRHDCPDCGRAGGESRDGQESSCPWMPLMVTGCVAPSALGSSSPHVAASVLERGDEEAAVLDRPPSHITDSLFHPPRR